MKSRILFLLLAMAMAVQGSWARTIKVLAIGNSFSVDAVEQNLYELAKAGGASIVIGNMYIGGCSLKRHAECAAGDKPDYQYCKIEADGAKSYTQKFTLKKALTDEKWDYVSLQQSSGVSGQIESYEPYLTQLIEYVKQLAPTAKIIWHQTWAYAKDSKHGEFPKYSRDQMKMYQMIVSCARTEMKKHGIKKVVPSGTTIQNARTTFIGDHMNRDGFHLELTYGRYAAACTWYEALTGKDVRKNTYAPTTVDERTAKAMRQAAHDAVKHPWRVTAR